MVCSCLKAINRDWLAYSRGNGDGKISVTSFYAVQQCLSVGLLSVFYLLFFFTFYAIQSSTAPRIDHLSFATFVCYQPQT